MSSEYFSVASCRDGKIATASFKKGNLIDYKEVDNKNKLHTGTTVIFKPDIEVFKDMTDTYSYKRICKELKDISYLNKGVRFIVINDNTGETEEFYSENGIADFINDKIENPLMRRPIIVSQSDGTDEIEVAFMWTKDPTQFYTFVNGLFCPENGSPVTAAKRAFTTQIKKLSGKDFDSELIRKGLVFAVNCRVSEPSFANQTKSKVNNPSLGTLTNAAIKQGLEEFSNTTEFTTIIEMLKKIQSAEKAADKAREAVLSQNKEIEKGLKKKIVLAEKLADCRFHDDRSQLMICEGEDLPILTFPFISGVI